MPAALPRTERYSTVAILFHWTIAFFVIVNLIVGIGHDYVPAMRAWMPGHKAIGILVLALTLARVAWRLIHRPPPLPAYVAGAHRAAAHAMHWALYALLVLMPLTGWMMVSGPEKRRPLTFFGAFDIPYLPVSSGGADAGHSGHGLLGWAMVILVVIHIAAALRHHLVLRNGVLLRMAPILGR